MSILPAKEMLLLAYRAAPREQHPILGAAHLLAGLHTERRRTALGATTDIDRQRARLVLAVDRWVATELPITHGGAHMHTETVGTVVDRLALLSTRAHETLGTAPPWLIHDAWESLAELAIGYEDLAYELGTGRRRLPRRAEP
ncbi:DUF4254 domain-containing protein [Nocardia cyriacigeorgica]|uniref:DUF4254 domain-containing protein n=1 Tax=Nocardia cyriacigeorgica TaxID=135487 RepID=UPI0018937D91|nr:DUF4254 domain-containing protein [Nocardia cyriacigeorgica]MBF6412534.1 DUF4254 domain-containing protein [Nocardia cyriacigeorgica]